MTTPVDREAPSRRRSTLAWIGGVLASLLVLGLIAAAFIRLPYVVVGPGRVTPLDADVLMIDGAPIYEHDGELLFLSVNVTNANRRPNVYRVLQAWLDPTIDLEKEDDFYGEEPAEDHVALNIRLMQQSQIAATTVALDALGYDVSVTPAGGFVQAVATDGTAHGTLRLGDVITAVDGVGTSTSQEVGDAIRSHEPGDELTMTVNRVDGFDGTRSEEVDVEIGERDGQPAVGILIADYVEEPPDVGVTIALDTRRVTGPSAGLAFTLAIIAEMSPTDITGGHEVAATGTIALDGRVGSVGGIKHKADAATRAGAALLLVPADEVEEARKHAGPSLDVAGVETIDDALAALVALGGELPESDVDARAA